MMADVDKKEEKLRRKRQAELLMANPLLVEAFAILKSKYFQAFQMPDTDETQRNMLWLACQMVGKVENHLNQAIKSGHVVELALFRETQAKKKDGSRLTGAQRT